MMKRARRKPVGLRNYSTARGPDLVDLSSWTRRRRPEARISCFQIKPRSEIGSPPKIVDPICICFLYLAPRCLGSFCHGGFVGYSKILERQTSGWAGSQCIPPSLLHGVVRSFARLEFALLAPDSVQSDSSLLLHSPACLGAALPMLDYVPSLPFNRPCNIYIHTGLIVLET